MVFIKKSESLILMITQIKNIEEIKLVTWWKDFQCFYFTTFCLANVIHK